MIYEYQCLQHDIFEVKQSVNDPPLEECPKCKEEGIKSEKPKKLISLSSFTLVGGGWSKDNYK